MIENKELNNIFSEEEENLIKNAFTQLDIKLGICDKTPEYLKKSFARKLEKVVVTKKSFSIKWKGYFASIVTAFSLGSLISYFLIMPVMVTRSINKNDNDNAAINESIRAPVTRSINVENPEEYSFKVISMVLKLDLEITIQRIADKTVMYIWPFKVNDQNQEELKYFLGLSPNIAGRVTIILHKNN